MKNIARARALFVLLLISLAASHVTYANGFDPKIFIQEFLTELAKEAVGVPEAIDTVLTVLQGQPEGTLDVLTIQARAKRTELVRSLVQASPEQSPPIRESLNGLMALEQRIAQAKTDLNAPHPEQGWDPFFALMRTNAPVRTPDLGQSVQVNFTLDKSPPTAPDNRPASYIVTAPALGNDAITVRPTNASAVVSMNNPDGSGAYPLALQNFVYNLPSFSILGAQTGENTITLSTSMGPPVGVANFAPGAQAGEFTLRFAATMANALYGDGKPFGPAIPVFVQAGGVVDLGSGIATVTANDPLLFPGIPGKPIGRPMFAAPTMALFDASANTISFHDMFFDAAAGLLNEHALTIAFLRYASGVYGVFGNVTDRMMGADLSIGDLHLGAMSADLVTFDPSTILIRDDLGVLLRADLRNITFKPSTGEFYGDIDTATAFSDLVGSAFLAEYLSFSNPTLQLLSPWAAGSLYAVTDNFTVSGQTVAPDFVNGGSIPEPRSIALVSAALLALTLVARTRSWSGTRRQLQRRRASRDSIPCARSSHGGRRPTGRTACGPHVW